jgi:medium-chain acyl-[acyl-carrier-protein] hydrolase
MIAGSPDPWIRFNQAVPSPRIRLLCFHHAGGGASWFRSWPAGLARSGIEVWPVQLPGRETRFTEPAAPDLESVVGDLVRVLGDRLDELPYGLYGHSAGAYVAGAFALRMRRDNRPGPAFVVVGAARPPGHPDPDTPIHEMPYPALLEKLQGYGGLPPQLFVYPELVEVAVRTARADLCLIETVTFPAQPWFDCPVTAAGGVEDLSVPQRLLPFWSATTSSRTSVVRWPGGHFPDPAGVASLLEVIRGESIRCDGVLGRRRR